MKNILVLISFLSASSGVFADQSTIMQTKEESQLNEIAPEFGSSHSSEILVQVVQAMLEKVIPKEKQGMGIEIHGIGLSTFDYKSLIATDRWLRVSASIKKCDVQDNRKDFTGAVIDVLKIAKKDGLNKASSEISAQVSDFQSRTEEQIAQTRKCKPSIGACWVRIHWYSNQFYQSQYNRIQSVSLYGSECAALRENNVLEMTTTVQKLSPTTFEVKGLN